MSKISEIIKSMEKPYFPFVPNAELYSKTGINRIRMSKILNGKIEPIFSEMQAIAAALNIDLNEIFKN